MQTMRVALAVLLVTATGIGMGDGLPTHRGGTHETPAHPSNPQGAAWSGMVVPQLAAWEKQFILVLWDQRGAGRTFGKSGPVGKDVTKEWADSIRAPHVEFLPIDGAGHYAFMTRSGFVLRELAARVRPLARAAGLPTHSSNNENIR